MKALGYYNAHSINDFSITELQLPDPVLGTADVLVRVKAISVNPVDYKIRQNKSSSNGSPIILGWDVAGVIGAIGSEVKGFKVGDEVFYAGQLNRNGGNAELQLIISLTNNTTGQVVTTGGFASPETPLEVSSTSKDGDGAAIRCI